MRTCNRPGCSFPVFGGGYCKIHQYLRRDKKKSIRQYSKKRTKENRKYSPLSKQFIQDNPECAIQSPDCIGITQGVHHVRGKIGERLMKVADFLPACNPCNSYVEKHDKWARNKGFKKSRLSK